jgi:predicted NBD/HSP70 family sugar kinase
MDETRLMVGALEINLGHIALSTATLAGTVLSTQRRTLDPGKSGPEEVLRIAAEMLNSAEGAPECGGRKLVHVAVACLAIVDTQHGKILKSSSLGWGKVDIAEELTRLTRSTITYSIDRLANFAVIAERRHGRWSDDAEILLLYGDIGIGGAYQHRADVFHSDHGFGANVGHLTVEFDGRPCYCGRRGCLETYVGIGPLANALDHVQDRPTNSPQVPLEKTLKAARQGIPEVIEELERQGKWLARGVELMRAAFDPAVVVIGGALAELAPLMRQSFQKEIARLAADSGQATAIETSSLGREAVLQGALASAVETVAREPWRSGFSGFRGK